jgi:hypothetical protein
MAMEMWGVSVSHASNYESIEKETEHRKYK